MPLTPVSNWIATYQPNVEAYYKAQAINPAIDPADLWRKWIDEAAQGIQAAPPYQSKGTTNRAAFAPVAFSPSGSPPQVAITLSNAWKAWYMAIKWTPSPPIPPFSVIEKVEASPVGVPLAYATLLAGLIAEFVVIPPDPLTAFALKATALGTLFYTATFAAGIQITGKDMSTPPAPLVIPMLPIL